MKKQIHYIKTEAIYDGDTTVVNETAIVDLSKVRAFNVIRRIPLIEDALSTFDIYNQGSLVIIATGKAKCHPEDTYDKSLGYYIAQSRAQMSIFKQYSNFMKFVVETIDKYFYNDITQLWNEADNSFFKIKDHVEFDLIKYEQDCYI